MVEEAVNFLRVAYCRISSYPLVGVTTDLRLRCDYLRL